MLAAATFLVVLSAGCALAGSSATLTIHYEATPISEIALGDDYINLQVGSSVSGDEPTTYTASTTYDLTTNGFDGKLSGSIGDDVAGGLSLSAELTPPEGAVGCGEVVLGRSPVDLITGIAPTAAGGLGLTSRLTAGVEAGLVEPSHTLFTLTVTDR